MKKLLLIGLLLSSLSAADEYFYLNLGFGKASVSYPNSSFTFADTTNSTYGIDLGVYFPYENFLFGFTMNGVSDYYQSNSTSNYIQINLLLRGLSVMYFLNNKVDGFFARLDMGSAELSASSSFGSPTSDNGFGYLVGIGYKWWSLYAALNISSYTVNSETSSSTMFNAGFLW